MNLVKDNINSIKLIKWEFGPLTNTVSKHNFYQKSGYLIGT